MRVLITGGAGFAGSYIAEEFTQAGYDVTVLDCLTYAGKIENIQHIPGLRFVYHDFRMPLDWDFMNYLEVDGKIDYIIHNGAETHVINSLHHPDLFIESNVVGTLNMLEAARSMKPKCFLYTSTDEVFGQGLIDYGGFNEWEDLAPSNPYSASKAAGEMLVKAWHKSYNVPYLITRTTNMYGKRQHPEKFIPLAISKWNKGESVDVHHGRDFSVGSRQWIHVSDQARALRFLLERPPDTYNDTFHIVGYRKTNEEVLRAIAEYMPKDMAYVVNHINAYEKWPGHDLHYNLNADKIAQLGWKPTLTFEEGIKLTV